MKGIGKVYFLNLNGLRFIAAFMVIIHHLDQLLFNFQRPNQWNNPTIQSIDHLGVTLFFVLSGFLITYLLLYLTGKETKYIKQAEETGRIRWE
ncbi:MAG: acyltransferase family protein [Paludibacteraceae bacterium]